MNPEKRPSVRTKTSCPIPIPTRASVVIIISLIPGAPLGPSYLITTTSPFLMFPETTAECASSSEWKILAGPSNSLISSEMVVVLHIAPLGEMFPFMTAMPPFLNTGSSAVVKTEWSDDLLTLLSSPMVCPETVIASLFRYSRISPSTAGTPPALKRSTTVAFPVGMTLLITGIVSESLSKSSRLSSTPTSLAMLRRWSTALVEPASAMVRMIPLSNASLVRMSFGFMFSLTRSTIRLPVCVANLSFSAETAGTVEEPGSAMPSPSASICMVFAVPISEHAPGPGHT